MNDLIPGDLIEMMSEFCHLWKVSAFHREGDVKDPIPVRRLIKGERAIVVAVKLDGKPMNDAFILTGHGMGWTDIAVWSRMKRVRTHR